MVNGDVFTLALPQTGAMSKGFDPVVIADGCETNTNYYTSSGSRGTCCCSCDKQVV